MVAVSNSNAAVTSSTKEFEILISPIIGVNSNLEQKSFDHIIYDKCPDRYHVQAIRGFCTPFLNLMFKTFIILHFLSNW